MGFKFSEKVQIVKIYNYRADTREFIGSGDAYIPPYTGLPANCTDIEPPLPGVGFAVIYNPSSKSWLEVEDHRRSTVYRTDTGEAVFISTLGPLPDNTTTIVPVGDYQVWDGTAWVTDELARQAAEVAGAEREKASLRSDADAQIEWRKDAVDEGIATDEEITLLAEWKTYRVQLMRIDTSKAPDIEWPMPPGVQAS